MIGIKGEFNDYAISPKVILAFLLYTFIITVAYFNQANNTKQQQELLERIVEYIALDYTTMVLDRNLDTIEQLVEQEWKRTSVEH
jgi:hypothetical protein